MFSVTQIKEMTLFMKHETLRREKWKKEVQKYKYHENRNKRRISITNEEQIGFSKVTYTF